MRNLFASLMIAIVVLSVSACTTIGLREHIFLSEPLWESDKFLKLKPPKSEKLLINVNETPGLALLVHQVLGEEVGLPTVKGKTVGESQLIVDERTPLPPQLAALPVTKAFVQSIRTSFLEANGIRSEKIPDTRFSVGDFREFATVLSKIALEPYQSIRKGEIGRNMLSHTFTDGKAITWQGLFVAYLTAYYNGNFVDRNGGLYSKPKIGLTITNETITAFVSIFIESTYDFIVLDAKGFLKVPIVYEVQQGRPVFMTANNMEPTLAKVVKNLTGNADMKYVVEEVQSDSLKAGITKQKLCVIRYFSGLSGDASQALTGIIVREFGGANIGFVIPYIKFSFGDNETLAKLIDTIVENNSRRLSEVFLSTVFYDLEHSREGNLVGTLTSEQEAQWNILRTHLEISELIDCFFEPKKSPAKEKS